MLLKLVLGLSREVKMGKFIVYPASFFFGKERPYI